MGRSRPRLLAALSATVVVLPAAVFLSVAQAGVAPAASQSCGADGAFLWNSDADFQARDIQLESEEPYGAQSVIYPSHAGDDGANNHRIQGGIYTLDGDQVRTYFDTYRVATVTQARLIFRARKDSSTDNISVKFGNHSLDGWVFGGYGVSFHDTEVQSKVEYYHNDQGDEESETLAQPMRDDTWYWFRIDIRTSGAEKVLDAYMDYDGTDDASQQWTPVMTGRTWTDGGWDPSDVPSGGEDSDEVEDGVYLGPLNRVWVRANGGGEVDYHRVTLCELGAPPTTPPTSTTTTTSGPPGTTTPPPSSPVKQPVVAVTASENDGNVPANAIDGNLGTRWSAEGDPEWIRFQLAGPVDVGLVKIAWYRGDQRRADFDVETSADGTTWTRVFTGSSSGTTLQLETHDVTDTAATHVRIVGHGNDDNAWNSITEVEIWGGPPGGTTPPTTTTTTTTTAPPATGFTFAVIGDYGDGDPEAEDVAERVHSWSPELVITTGDNNYNGADDIDSDVGQFYHRYISPYSGDFGPGSPDRNRFFPTLGNHDWDTDNGGAYLDYFTLPGNERYYDFEWTAGGVRVHFFAVDADDEEPDGNSATSTQGQWLQQRLAASTAQWNVVYMHHSPFSSGTNHGSDTELQWPYRQWGADVVLSGHDHIYERIIRDGLPYFVNGLGGRSRYDCGSRVTGSQICSDADYGAMRVDVSSTAMRLRFITRGGTVRDDYTISA